MCLGKPRLKASTEKRESSPIPLRRMMRRSSEAACAKRLSLILIRAKKTKTNRSGFMDIIDEIKADHQVIEGLLEKIGSSSVDDARSHRKLIQELLLAVLAHNYAEEEVLYRRLREIRLLKGLVSNSYHEHRMVVELLQSLKKFDPAGADWGKRFATARKHLDHHWREEERAVLPQVKRLFSLDLREEIGEELRSLEEIFLQRTEGREQGWTGPQESEIRP
jgi:hemerythrin superfamily protein